MATNFGFMPVEQSEYYFVSYNTQDTTRVAKITREMNRRGIPLWYDEGLLVGIKWEQQITRKIEGCRAVILFVTKKLMARENPYVQVEYEIAQEYEKRVFIIFLDMISFNDVSTDLKGWWVRLKKLHGIAVSEINDTAEIVDIIDSHIHFIKTRIPSHPAPVENKPKAAPLPQKTIVKPTEESVIIPFVELEEADHPAVSPSRNATGTNAVNPASKSPTPKKRNTAPVFVDEEHETKRTKRTAFIPPSHAGKKQSASETIFVDEKNAFLSQRKSITNYNPKSVPKPSETKMPRNSVAIHDKNAPLFKDSESEEKEKPKTVENIEWDLGWVIVLFIVVSVIIFLVLSNTSYSY